MGRPHPLLMFAVLLVASSWGVGDSAAQTCLLADFDEDGSLWTIRTECPERSCDVNFILEVPAVPPLDRWFRIDITEGCCDVFFDGYYGARLEMDLDYSLVDFYEKAYTTCTCCSSWIIDGHLRDDITLVLGQRYRLGRGVATALCDEAQPCTPPHDFSASFMLVDGPECDPNGIHMDLMCELTTSRPGFAVSSGIGGRQTASFRTESISCASMRWARARRVSSS